MDDSGETAGFAQWSEDFQVAISLAVEVHASQLRRGTTIPYISHLLAVASIVLDYGGQRTATLGAILHDAGEDGGGLDVLRRIAQTLGQDVADVVEQCSDTFETPKPPWLARKKSFLLRLPQVNDDSRLVIAADKLHNLTTMSRELRRFDNGNRALFWNQFHGQYDGSRWYYRECLAVLSGRVNPGLEADLEVAFSGCFPADHS